ncbi:MAG: hypothetical protein A2W93_06625 [Bacteroidetes bacterium GWF2_43_63]|nr:MAG: hypothetical protein A2W94_07910 [Bacteroidetes bacterium GWE2_42_42]OFY53294.1 MAG: hypothetical protein A2W93_06625 [Bacteroidetes bacterium GWF2_43_63]HBG71712.1 hypothetical protein [Bacteroidales bacterium]HCB61623.1 hypothetical protein [Bacteroidales bacterium]HCY22835.1 hypothetical protein [Bacteroidales bacterium]
MRQAKIFAATPNLLLIIGLMVIAVGFSSCGCKREKKEFDREVSDSKLDSLSFIKVSINRYEQDLFAIPVDSLKEGLVNMQDKYSFFYSPEDLNDPMNIAYMKQYLKDPTILSLYREAMKQYPSLAWLESELTMTFRRIKYLIPSWTVPTVYTYVSGGDIELPVKYADNNLVIALDLFLGEKYPVYNMWGIPQYISNRMTKDYLVIKCATEICRAYLEKNCPAGKSMLDKMVYEGKLLYFTDVTVPSAADSIRIGYTGQQLFWAEKNQGNVWGFFIEKKLLHSTEMREINKFIGEAPFTSAFSNNSAPRIGRYIGWQIVRSYMAKNKNVTFEQLLKNNNSQEILNKSGYKPEKTE